MRQVMKGGRYQVVNGVAPLWVSARAEEVSGFVEQDGGLACLLQDHAVVANGVTGQYPGAHVFAGFAVDLDLSGGDEILAATSRAKSAGC